MFANANISINSPNGKPILTKLRSALTNKRGKYHLFHYLYYMKNHLSLDYDRFVILVWIF